MIGEQLDLMAADHLAPVHLLRLHPAAGSQQLSSRSRLKLGTQLRRLYGWTVQYQGHKCAYGLEGSGFEFQELVQQPLVIDIIIRLIM